MLADRMRMATGVEDVSLLGVIAKLGLTTGLKGVYDLGDIRSYDGVATQTLADYNGADDFHFGATSSSAGDDPTFNGVAGDLSSAEFASTDGADLFRAKAQPTWANEFHKNNALFSCVGYMQIPNLGSVDAIWGDHGGSSATIGTSLWVNASEQMKLNVVSSPADLSATSSATFTTGTPVFFGLSVDEAAGANGVIMDIDGTQETFTSTYSAPSAAASTYPLELMASGNAELPLQNTSRLYEIAFWQGIALTGTNISDLKTEMDTRFV